MQELISLDELNKNSVSVATRKYIEEDGVKYLGIFTGEHMSIARTDEKK